jgi:hypothetical protein
MTSDEPTRSPGLRIPARPRCWQIRLDQSRRMIARSPSGTRRSSSRSCARARTSPCQRAERDLPRNDVGSLAGIGVRGAPPVPSIRPERVHPTSRHAFIGRFKVFLPHLIVGSVGQPTDASIPRFGHHEFSECDSTCRASSP